MSTFYCLNLFKDFVSIPIICIIFALKLKKNNDYDRKTNSDCKCFGEPCT